jgi:small subunit ribosomal protein S16
MAVKIRLTRLGKKKQPTYRVVVMDARKQRDGEYIEQLGFYDPRPNPSVVEIDNERALHWLTTGAQPTDRARKLLEISGAWTQFKVARGEIHTVGGDAPGTSGSSATSSKAKAEAKAEAKADTGADADSEVAVVDEVVAAHVAADQDEVVADVVEDTVVETGEEDAT